MLYMLKEKLWSFAGSYAIRDATKSPTFTVEGTAFSWGDKLSFRSASGQELAFISQKLWSLKPRYELYRDGVKFAEVVKEWTWFRKQFTLDVPGPNDYTIDGSFWDYEYTFARSGTIVARVSRRLWSLADTYGVDIVDGEDDVAILATVVVIDLVCADQT